MPVHITLTAAQIAKTVKRLTSGNYPAIVSDAAATFQLYTLDAVLVTTDSNGVVVTVRGISYRVVKHTRQWLGHDGYVFITEAGEVAQPLPYVAPVPTSYAKDIKYDRDTRDYGMWLQAPGKEWELVGFARTYVEAEATLDQLVFELLNTPDVSIAEVVEAHRATLAETADIEAEQAVA